MASQSDTATASTITASKRKKSRSPRQNLSDRVAGNWPFSKMDPKLLARAHREYKAQQIADAEPAPY